MVITRLKHAALLYNTLRYKVIANNDKDALTTLLSFLVLSIPSMLYLSYWFATKGNGRGRETANAT
jgi:hypothetical protein